MSPRFDFTGNDLYLVTDNRRALVGRVREFDMQAGAVVNAVVDVTPVFQLVIEEVASNLVAQLVAEQLPVIQAMTAPKGPHRNDRGPADGKGARRRERWRRW